MNYENYLARRRERDDKIWFDEGKGEIPFLTVEVPSCYDRKERSEVAHICWKIFPGRILGRTERGRNIVEIKMAALNPENQKQARTELLRLFEGRGFFGIRPTLSLSS